MINKITVNSYWLVKVGTWGNEYPLVYRVKNCKLYEVQIDVVMGSGRPYLSTLSYEAFCDLEQLTGSPKLLHHLFN